MPEFPFFFPMFPFDPIKPIPPKEPAPPVKPLEPTNPFEIKPINFDNISNVKPGDNENIQITASSSNSKYSNVDGVEKKSGKAHTMSNVNGNIRQEIVEFDNNPDHQDVGKPSEDKNPIGEQKLGESKLSKVTRLGKFSKLNRGNTNDIKHDAKPTDELKTKEVQTKSDDRQPDHTVEHQPDGRDDNNKN